MGYLLVKIEVFDNSTYVEACINGYIKCSCTNVFSMGALILIDVSTQLQRISHIVTIGSKRHKKYKQDNRLE